MNYKSNRGAAKVIYGHVVLHTAYCEPCDETAVIIDGLIQCCLRPYSTSKIKKWRVGCSANFVRKQPSKSFQTKQLTRQDNRCIYCGLQFNTLIQRQGREARAAQLKLNWDHVMPFCWRGDNSEENFVAACQICNGIKSSKMFSTLEETREYILKIRQKKGWQEGCQVPEMSDFLHAEEK